MQGYNGQIAVDAAHQVIVAHRLVTTSADTRALVPLVDGVRVHLGRKPREVSGDAGFASEANLAALEARGIAGYLAPGRASRRGGCVRPAEAGEDAPDERDGGAAEAGRPAEPLPAQKTGGRAGVSPCRCA